MLKCIECVDVELEEVKVQSFPSGIGYRCKLCGYIYNLQEYKRLAKQILGIEALDGETINLNPSDNVITIGAATPSQEVSKDLHDLLNLKLDAAPNLFSDDIEER